MKIAVTGGTGFLGRNLARVLAEAGHQVVLIARGNDKSDFGIRTLDSVEFFSAGLDDVERLLRALQGCHAVAHCAGINRELGRQTYEAVHVQGTRNLVTAAQRAGVAKVVLSSFLRARPSCGSAYHESKWAAEEIVRSSGLDYTVFKCGVIYGRGDHMLDHLSHAFYTFPVFGFVGFRDQGVRPAAVEDVCRVFAASLVEGALSRATVSLVGPEELSLRQAVRRVARVVGRQPLMVPLPLWFHYGLGWFIEKIMKVPMVSISQVRMLSEGVVEALPACEALPHHLLPRTPFSEEQIRKGLPPAGPFKLSDLRLPWGSTGEWSDRAGVLAPPPLIFLGFLVLSWVLDRGLLHVPVPLPGLWCGILAALLGAAALTLIWGAAGRFRRAGTNIRPWLPSTAVVTSGPYRFTRNPMYLGMTCLYLAGGLLLDSVVPLLLLAPLVKLMNRGVIEREELYLESKFGEEYRRYKVAVPRWLSIPGWT